MFFKVVRRCYNVIYIRNKLALAHLLEMYLCVCVHVARFQGSLDGNRSSIDSHFVVVFCMQRTLCRYINYKMAHNSRPHTHTVANITTFLKALEHQCFPSNIAKLLLFSWATIWRRKDFSFPCDYAVYWKFKAWTHTVYASLLSLIEQFNDNSGHWQFTSGKGQLCVCWKKWIYYIYYMQLFPI